MLVDELIFDPDELRVYLTLAIYILAPLLIIHFFKRHQWMQRCGTVIAAYTVGLLIAISGIIHFPHDSLEEMLFMERLDWMMKISIPLAIPLMLFNCDFRLWTKALPKTICALIAGLVSVVTAVLTGYYLLRQLGIPEFGKLAAMLTGMYTGGTMNYNALGASLNVPGSLMAIVLAFDMLLTVGFLFFILSGGYRLIRRTLPYTDETTPAFRREQRNFVAPVQEIENYEDFFKKDNLLGAFYGLLLSGLFLLIGVGVSYGLWWIGWIPQNAEMPEQPVLNELVVILVITTLSIVASFSQKIRELPKTFELGMFFILVFSVGLSSLVDWHNLTNNMWGIGLLIAWVFVAGMIIHWILCRLLHVSGDLYTISMTALFCSPPFVPPVVGAMGNKKVLISGLVIGLIGYAVGTYLGIGVAWLLGVL